MNNSQVVTQEQIDRCHRTIDMATNSVFYQVESESDPNKLYAVRYNRKYRRFSCTCPSGQIGFSNARSTCKHCRWSVAAEAEHQDFVRAERLAAERIEASKQYQAEQRVHAVYSACVNLK